MEKFYITAAIDYVSDVPHLGHALEKTQADVIARYQRFLGKEVYFLSGADEHGLKILRNAEASGKNVQDFVDENAEAYKKLAEALGISIDDFIRTTDKKRHWPGARALWEKLKEAGDIYKADYKGSYCVGCEAYITEKELVGGKCPIHDKEPELIEEKNYFFRLSKYAEEIKNKIKSDELKIIPVSRKNEALSMMGGGMEDISFSRPVEKLNWGIPVPGDLSQIIYVWCDALTNYISALGYGSSRNIDISKFRAYWPANLHVIGKDILRFHAIIWPAMLMSAGLPLPKEILVHGFALSGGRKMSKTLGNVINPFDLIERYGADAVRYYLLREITTFEDGNITEEKFKEAYNANLANGLGNLTARIMKMSEQYLGAGEIDARELEKKFLPEYAQFMDNFEINKAADFIWQKISDLDKKIQETEPFKLIKTEPGRAKEILSELVSGLKQIAGMLAPFLPETSEKILRAIKANKMPEPLFLRK